MEAIKIPPKVSQPVTKSATKQKNIKASKVIIGETASEVLARLNLNPFEEMAKIAKKTRLTKEDQIRFDMYDKLAPYVQAKKKKANEAPIDKEKIRQKAGELLQLPDTELVKIQRQKLELLKKD